MILVIVTFFLLLAVGVPIGFTLGIAGVAGNGQSELLEVLGGMRDGTGRITARVDWGEVTGLDKDDPLMAKLAEFEQVFELLDVGSKVLAQLLPEVLVQWLPSFLFWQVIKDPASGLCQRFFDRRGKSLDGFAQAPDLIVHHADVDAVVDPVADRRRRKARFDA